MSTLTDVWPCIVMGRNRILFVTTAVGIALYTELVESNSELPMYV